MSEIAAEGKNNLPCEAEIAKIHRYIELTGVTFPVGTPYQMKLNDLFELSVMSREDAVKAIRLAFDYGRAKGYRAAKAEVKKKCEIKEAAK